MKKAVFLTEDGDFFWAVCTKVRQNKDGSWILQDLIEDSRDISPISIARISPEWELAEIKEV